MVFVALAAALLVRPSPDARVRRLTASVSPVPGAAARRSSLPRFLLPVVVGGGVWAMLGGSAGLVAGVLAGFGAWRLLAALPSREVKRRDARLVADLPIAVDLLAACLSAGASWTESVEAVADALRGPLAEELTTVAARVRLGADPAEAWLTLASTPALSALARTASRAAETGAALAPTLARLARDQRRASRNAADARARKAAIHAVAPLGLCFLPAFVLLGIVPAIAGIAQSITLP